MITKLSNYLSLFSALVSHVWPKLPQFRHMSCRSVNESSSDTITETAWWSSSSRFMWPMVGSSAGNTAPLFFPAPFCLPASLPFPGSLPRLLASLPPVLLRVERRPDELPPFSTLTETRAPPFFFKLFRVFFLSSCFFWDVGLEGFCAGKGKLDVLISTSVSSLRTIRLPLLFKSMHIKNLLLAIGLWKKGIMVWQ